jgi:energy-coupling factor transporter transmembrane protein EcfT
VFRLSQAGRSRTLALAADSPLRRSDPRAKLLLSLVASLMVMLPLARLGLFVLLYVGVLAWARLLRPAARQLWGMRWIFLILFVLDLWLVGWELAVIITLRLGLLAGVFALLFATTTITEFRLALEQLGLSYRYAFSLSLAFQSLSLLDDEWRSILEAQRARHALPEVRGWRSLWQNLGNLVALTVPAVVLTTRRAWAITEAAYGRGFDAPHRRPFRTLTLHGRDWALMAAALAVAIGFFWRIR